MLADNFNQQNQTGLLNSEVQLPASALHALIDFIADDLPRWRDDPERVAKTAETELTDQLCARLNSVARTSAGWDHYQFRTEAPDDVKKGRKIDLVAAPCGAIIWIDGRRCTQYDTLLPIECKRLPTPKDNARDEREYVVNRKATTGGMQRFKEGNHGANHSLAAMIAYVQTKSPKSWFVDVNAWITELSVTDDRWSKNDLLRCDSMQPTFGIMSYRSTHIRTGNLSQLELRHLWIDMGTTVGTAKSKIKSSSKSR